MVKKILITLLICTILMTTLISAWEFDNVKSYDTTERVVIFKNSILGIPTTTIAEVKLDTPLDNHVGAGYQKVAQFTINGQLEYEDVLKELKLYDVKNNLKEIQRDFDYKYLTYEDVNVNDYEVVCEKGINKNGSTSDICSRDIIGNHIEQKEVWTTLGKLDLVKEQTLVIGIFTDVQVGIKLNGYLLFFGKEVNEWAVWTNDININIVGYWDFEDATMEPLEKLEIDPEIQRLKEK